MGLVLARKVGEAFWVADTRYVVESITEEGVRLSADGRSFDFSETMGVQLVPSVSVMEAIRRTTDTARIMFDAHRSIPILRDELVSVASQGALPRSSFALLAPVPGEHLGPALDTVTEEGKVAFGSRAWEVFREFDESLDGQPAPVLIYASHEGAPYPPMATWVAEYSGHVEGRGGRHPDGLRFRPKSTEKYPEDNAGHWAVFWEVAQLKKLSASDQIKIADLKSGTTGKQFAPNFRPEGPAVILNPFA